jgi:hypothetical protein
METEMTDLKTSTLRPGLLVSLKTSLRGNVAWDRQDIERERLNSDGALQAKWETERTISDPVEYEAACKIRNKASSLIRSICAHSAFGLLCPEADADKLSAAIQEAQALTAAFNSVAKLTRISVYVMTGRIAADDVEAMKAINSEMRDLMSMMQEGINNLDKKTIDEAVRKARSVGMMLSPDLQARVQIAVDAAKQTALKIGKAGEQAAQEIDKRAIRMIAEQRTAFLDLDEAAEIAAPRDSGRAIDLTPDEDVSKAEFKAYGRAPVAPKLELE